MNLYDEAVKLLPAEHIDHHESDLYIKVTPDSRILVDAYRAELIAEGSPCADGIKMFRSDHPEDKGAYWYDIPLHYTPFWIERGCAHA